MELTLNEIQYGPGAMGEVFDYRPSLNRQSSYKNFKIIRPAVFVADSGDGFRLQKKGFIDPGEKYK
jgi:hypothetical protein